MSRYMRKRECLLCNVDVPFQDGCPEPHRCPHGLPCEDRYMSDYPDCDECRRTFWRPFGDVARELLQMQAQYASRYVDGRHDYPRLGVGLRFRGDPEDYHALRIHPDDIAEFVRRVRAERG